MARKHRKIRKRRGSRTCGEGSHKKGRKAGSRGGVGMAGTHKGKWTWVIKYDPNHFGDYGFEVPRAVKTVYETVNIGELDEIAKREKLKEIDVTKLNYDKVLGKGKLTQPLIVKALGFSSSAVKKIEASGGKAIVLGEPKKE